MLADVVAILRSGGAFKKKRNFDTWMRAATRTGRFKRRRSFLIWSLGGERLKRGVTPEPD